MNQILLEELKTMPTGFSNNPETVSSLVEMLIPIIMAMQTEKPLKECKQQMNDEILELTKNIPKERSLRARLCDDSLWPEQKSSFATLIARGKVICSRLIKEWNSACK